MKIKIQWNVWLLNIHLNVFDTFRNILDTFKIVSDIYSDSLLLNTLE